jgi:hypothetical protein
MNHIKHALFQSIDSRKKLRNNKNTIFNKNSIFREFDKIKDLYVATDKFYISCEIDDNVYEFNEIDINSLHIKNYMKMIPYFKNDNFYVIDDDKVLDINSQELYCIDLILIKNVSFTINETQFNKNDLFKKFINNDSDIDDKLIEDIYYNNDFSEKINLDLPKKINYSLENVNILKKYLFKVNLTESTQIFYQENNKLLL